MFSAFLMPMVSSMSRVALPVIRDEFQLSADMTAWVSVAFALPFMIFMPIYGRLSDGLDRRRLILIGIAVFWIGASMMLTAVGLGWLMVGQATMGIGVAGMMPLGMALISRRFHASERGKALGTWSSAGPMTAFISPAVAGFLVAGWGWRGAYALPFITAFVALGVVYKGIPPRSSDLPPRFLRTFDWGGVLFLATALIALAFYLSSRAITGIAPFQDVRLLSLAVLLFGCFVWWEKKRDDPFVSLGIFANHAFWRATLCACARMFNMAALGFLIPLYLVDVHGLRPAQLGGMLIINSGFMVLVVRIGGRLSDRWTSRWPVIVGLAIQTSVMIIFSQLSGDVSLWMVGSSLAFHGLGAGLMLAALHRAVMGTVPESQMGGAAGLYSMIRFLGVVVSTALCGVLLQHFIDAALPILNAYQNVFFIFAGFPLLGLISGFGLRESR